MQRLNPQRQVSLARTYFQVKRSEFGESYVNEIDVRKTPGYIAKHLNEFVDFILDENEDAKVSDALYYSMHRNQVKRTLDWMYRTNQVFRLDKVSKRDFINRVLESYDRYIFKVKGVDPSKAELTKVDAEMIDNDIISERQRKLIRRHSMTKRQAIA